MSLIHQETTYAMEEQKGLYDETVPDHACYINPSDVDTSEDINSTIKKQFEIDFSNCEVVKVEEYLTKYPAFIKTQVQGNSLLHHALHMIATHADGLSMVELILDQNNVDIDEICMKQGGLPCDITPLAYTIFRLSSSTGMCVKLLVNRGANVRHPSIWKVMNYLMTQSYFKIFNLEITLDKIIHQLYQTDKFYSHIDDADQEFNELRSHFLKCLREGKVDNVKEILKEYPLLAKLKIDVLLPINEVVLNFIKKDFNQENEISLLQLLLDYNRNIELPPSQRNPLALAIRLLPETEVCATFLIESGINYDQSTLEGALSELKQSAPSQNTKDSVNRIIQQLNQSGRCDIHYETI